MIYEFDSEIKMLEGKIKWKVVYFPHSAKETFQTDGRVPIQLTVDGHEFEHMLLPSKNGHYFVFNEFIRRATHKELGDMLHVLLKKDEKAREIVLPDVIKEKLENREILNTFLNQPDYMKREQINYIEIAKKEETKHNRIEALIDKLRSKEGK